MSHGSVAKSVRLSKEKNPQNYCPYCLWRVRDARGNYIGPCGNHGDLRSDQEREYDQSQTTER